MVTTYSNNQIKGEITPITPVPPEAPELLLPSIEKHLVQQVDRLNALANRLHFLADRVFGSIPSGVSEDFKDGTGSEKERVFCALDALERAGDSLLVATNRLGDIA